MSSKLLHYRFTPATDSLKAAKFLLFPINACYLFFTLYSTHIVMSTCILSFCQKNQLIKPSKETVGRILDCYAPKSIPGIQLMSATLENTGVAATLDLFSACNNSNVMLKNSISSALSCFFIIMIPKKWRWPSHEKYILCLSVISC